MEVFFLVISALIFCKVVFQKSPFSLFFCIAAVVAGTVMKSFELAVYGGLGAFLLGIVIRLFSKDATKRGKAVDVFIGTTLSVALTWWLLNHRYIGIMHEEEKSGICVFLLGAFLSNFAFRKFIPKLTDDDERLTLDDIKNFSVKGLFWRLDDYPLLSNIIGLCLAFGATYLILGEANDLFHHLFSGRYFLHKILFLSLFALYRFLVQLPLWGIWKIHEDIMLGLLLPLVAYVTYTGVSAHIEAHPVAPDNLAVQFYSAIAAGVRWVGSFLPDWFYAEGWMGIWFIIRCIIGIILIVLTPALVAAIPFYIVYEIWHAKEDKCNALYELVAVTVLCPLFFGFTTWSLKSIDHNNEWLHGVFTIAYFVIFLRAAIQRVRCPKCGCSNLERSNEYKVTHAAELESVEREAKLESDGRVSRSEKENMRQQVDKHFDLTCKRCNHTWHNVHTSFNRFSRSSNDFSKKHNHRFRNSAESLRGDDSGFF